MNIKVRVWRQSERDAEGAFETHEVEDVETEASFLEMLDGLNAQLIRNGERPIAFDHDCREGICGSCDLLIDGLPHGPKQVSTCQLYMREFADEAEITVEPFRASSFPVLCDLVVDRSSLDRIVAAGGYIDVSPGGPKPEPNTMPIAPETVEAALDAAVCIGCGACVAACPNGSAMLFTGAKVSHLNALPQGQPQRWDRVREMVAQMDAEGFGGCTNHGECSAVCPQGISIKVIGDLNRDWRRSVLKHPQGSPAPEAM